jgi:cellulose 1,4-beta-cellobiosidase
MDVWEANSVSTAYTPHPCTVSGQTRCSGTECSSFCDQPGCDFNSFRMGDKSFYGKGLTVDTSKKITVVTQFITADGTATGALSEIRRLYVQDGKIIQNSKTNVSGMAAYDSITEQFCAAQKTAFKDENVFAAKGGFTNMGKAFDNGMVLVMSIWDDHAANMLWLDSNYPTSGSASTPGIARGTCATTSGVPSDVETNSPNASVTYSNIRFGDIGSTYTGTAGTTTTTTRGTVTTSTSSAPAVRHNSCPSTNICTFANIPTRSLDIHVGLDRHGCSLCSVRRNRVHWSYCMRCSLHLQIFQRFLLPMLVNSGMLLYIGGLNWRNLPFLLSYFCSNQLEFLRHCGPS